MPANDSHRPSFLAPWLRHPARVVPLRARNLLRRASIIGQIGVAAGALSAFWLDATSAQYHGGTADVTGWGIGIFILAALPVWVAVRNIDSHPRPVSILLLVCGVWLAAPSLWGLADPGLFIAPEFMVEPTSAPEGIRMISSLVLVSGALLLLASYFGFKADSLLSGRESQS